MLGLSQEHIYHGVIKGALFTNLLSELLNIISVPIYVHTILFCFVWWLMSLRIVFKNRYHIWVLQNRNKCMLRASCINAVESNLCDPSCNIWLHKPLTG